MASTTMQSSRKWQEAVNADANRLAKRNHEAWRTETFGGAAGSQNVHF